MYPAGKFGFPNQEPHGSPPPGDAMTENWAADYRFSPVAQVTLDRNGCIRRLNITASILLKGDPTELVNVPFVSFVDKLDYHHFFDHFADAFSGHKKAFSWLTLSNATRATGPVALQSVSCLIAGDRFCRTAIIRLPPFAQGNGRNPMLVTAQDLLTREQTTEQDSAEPKSLWRQILANNSIASALISLETERLIEVNPIFCRLTGHLEKELLGQPLSTIALSRSNGEQPGDLFDSLLCRESKEFEARINRPDGSKSEVLISAKRIGSQQERSLLIMMQDLTDLRRLRQDVVSISEAERRRFGRDLHDSYCQDLTAIAFFAESIASGLASRDGDAASQVRMLVAMVQKTAENVRALATELASQRLEESGLTTALKELTRQVSLQYGLPVTANLDPKLDERRVIAQGINVYRIAQEALSNAARHSHAQRITLGLRVDGHTGVLEVQDDGIGFLTNERPAGLGLRSMQYRASTIRAILQVDSNPGSGTRVTCRFPLVLQ